MIRSKLIRLLQIYLILVAVIVAFVVGIRIIGRSFFFHFPFVPLGAIQFAIIAILGLLLLFAWIGLGVAVYYDAKRRGMEPLVWALVAALVPYLLGLIAYLIVRHPVQVVCAFCGQPLAGTDLFCKNCGHAVQPKCSSCGQPAAADARFCPHCGTPLVAPQAQAMPGS